MATPWAWLPAEAQITPFLSWAALRLAIVGDFGLVSYGGYALSGMAVELMGPTTVASLAPDLAPLATEILTRKQAANLPPAFGEGLSVSMGQYDENYSPNIFQIAVPAAESVYGNDNVALNPGLTRLSREVIATEKADYLLWAGMTWPRAVAKLLYRSPVLWLLVPMGLAAGLVAWRRRPDGPPAAVRTGIQAMALIAAGFFVAHECLLIAAGAYGDSRYIIAAGVFVPPAIAMFVAAQLREARTSS